MIMTMTMEDNMVKKDELKVGLLLRKKSWRSMDLRYKVNAIGKKQVLMECVKIVPDHPSVIGNHSLYYFADYLTSQCIYSIFPMRYHDFFF